MKIKVNTLPIDDIVLEFEDGVTKNIKICNYMFALIDQEFEEGCTKTLFSTLKKPYEYGSRLIYAGLKAADHTVTLEQAQAITLMLSIDTIIIIAEKCLELYSNANADKNKEDTQKKLKNLSEEEMQVAAKVATKMLGL